MDKLYVDTEKKAVMGICTKASFHKQIEVLKTLGSFPAPSLGSE